MLYGLQNRFHYASFAYRTRSIRTSPPIPCDPAAACEVHTMLGARDLPLYLVAIKSLLRWYRRLAVIVHSDGSLDRSAFDLIARHVPGVRFIDVAEADRRAADALRDRPALARWRSHDAAYRRLIDTELFSTTPRRIIMDADVLVLGAPREVMRWAESGSTPFLLGQAPDDDTADESREPTAADHVQVHFRHRVPELAKATGLAPRFLQGTTAGFHGCTNEPAFDRIERLMAACESLHLPMTQWGGDQCAVIYLLSAAGATRLNEERCFNFDESRAGACGGAEIIHFYGTHRFYQGIYTRLAAGVCRSLRDGSAVSAEDSQELLAPTLK